MAAFQSEAKTDTHMDRLNKYRYGFYSHKICAQPTVANNIKKGET